jgi:hypothetical protein
MSTQGTPYTEESTTRQQSGFFGRDEPGQGGGWQMAHQRRARNKPFFLTSEFMALLGAIAAVVIAGAVADNFDAKGVWTLVTVLAAAYIVSRGLSKIGRGDGNIGGR